MYEYKIVTKISNRQISPTNKFNYNSLPSIEKVDKDTRKVQFKDEIIYYVIVLYIKLRFFYK